MKRTYWGLVDKKKMAFGLLMSIAISTFVLAIAPTIVFDSPAARINLHEAGNNLNLLANITAANGTCLYEYGQSNTTISTCGLSNYSEYVQPGDLEQQNFGSTADFVGVNITIGGGDIFAYSFNKTDLDGATRGILMANNLNNLSTCTFSGNNCVFSSPVKLSANQNYLIMTDGAGSSITRYRDGGVDQYPFESTYFNWTNGTANYAMSDDDIWGGVQALNVSNTGVGSGTFQLDANINVTDYEDRKIIIYANDSEGVSTTQETNWNYTLFINSQVNNLTSYETETQGFEVNISYMSSDYSAITADLYLGGTAYSGTKTGSSDNIKFTKSLAVPSSIGSKNKLWAFYLTNTTGTFNINSSTQTVQVNQINLTLCGVAPQNIAFLNFTFVNETAGAESVNASIPSATFYYSLSALTTINKTYTYSNTTEWASSNFCFSPTNKSINANGFIRYTNSYSQQRTYTLQNSLLTNISTITTLRLLPTSAGIFTRYQTIDSNGDSVRNVFALVEKEISGSMVTIASDYTDDSGLVTFFLNPDDTYSYTFSKTGFSDNTFTLNPTSSDIYTVTMGGGNANSLNNGTEAGQNLTYNFVPRNSTLLNGTTYTFAINVTGNGVTATTFNLTNSSGQQVVYSGVSGGGIVGGSFNTGNNTRLYGKATITNNGETTTLTNIWIINEEYIGDYSLFRQLNLFNDYGFAPWIKILLSLIIITGSVMVLSYQELLDTGESKVAVVMILVWLFSIFGWLALGNQAFIQDTSASILSRFASQYGIAMVTTAGSLIFIFRRFIR